MSGELLLENNGRWKRIVPAVLVTCLLTGGVMALCLRRLSLTGMGLAITAALTAYVLFRVLYPIFDQAFSKGERGEGGTWRVTLDTLYLNDTAIPRSTIKMVHCWPNRDALGHAGTGWTVNIETTGKNHLLRSLTGGEDADRSIRQLRALVVALGYGARWQEN